ncbi:MAG: 4-vinyl reductase [Planctomycetia bacterium]|nr:4-vinyl reductase [Planctomycetia bacterium]
MSETIPGLSCEPGRIALNGVRFLLVRPETLVGFQKAIEKEAPELAARALQAGGADGGGRSARRLRDDKGLRGRELVEAMCKMGTEIGWGRFRVESFADGAFTVVVESSPYAEAYGKAAAPVCHFLAGVMKGVGEALWGNASATENACAAHAAGTCQFRVRRISP